MATLRRRLHRHNGTNYDTVHFETDSDVVLLSDGNTLSNHISAMYNRITTLESTMPNKSDNGHVHDDLYYREYEVNNLLNNKVNTSDFNSLKTSVSNGKSAVASAITDKGVSTSATASFNTMASNIRSIRSTPNPFIDDYNSIVSIGHELNVCISVDHPTSIPNTITVDFINEYYRYGNYTHIYFNYYQDLVIPFKTLTANENTTTLDCSYSNKRLLNFEYSYGKWSDQGSGTLKLYGSHIRYRFLVHNDPAEYFTSLHTRYVCAVQGMFSENDWSNTFSNMIIKNITY